MSDDVTAQAPGLSPALRAQEKQGKRYYEFDEARKHKMISQSVWARAIWVDDAGDFDIAVLHWMGGAYKVVGRYRHQESDGIERAKAHVEHCSKFGYCPTTQDDNEAYLAELNQPRGLSASEGPTSEEPLRECDVCGEKRGDVIASFYEPVGDTSVCAKCLGLDE